MNSNEIAAQVDDYIIQFPAYEKILNFYKDIALEQQKSSKVINIIPRPIKENWQSFHIREGFPLVEKQDFIIDLEAAFNLFESLCDIARTSNEKLKNNVQHIEEAVSINALNIKELLRDFANDDLTEKAAGEFSIDPTILRFLIHESIKPSVAANVADISKHTNLKTWLRGYCPVCGSLPHISELKGEGNRFFRCSFCGFNWPSERLKCPFCENTDSQKLHFFYAEGQEAYRVELCNNCHQYIKTVDSRKLNHEPCLPLDDIVTIHLDILAQEKGFRRPAPSLWGL